METHLIGLPFWDSSPNVVVQPVTGGSNSRRFMPHFGIVASLGANVNARYIWKIQTAPSPSDTLKLLVTSIANATTGNAQLNPSWGVSNSGFNFDTISLTAEGVTTITWSAGQAYAVKETKITLDALSKPTAGQYLVLGLLFATASWTLAQRSFWSVHLIAE